MKCVCRVDNKLEICEVRRVSNEEALKMVYTSTEHWMYCNKSEWKKYRARYATVILPWSDLDAILVSQYRTHHT